jgi:probable phosphoglycerate mutase
VTKTKKRLNLIVVRHGLTDWNEDGRLLGRNPIELNPRGLAQVAEVGKALKALPIEAVYSSPQKRTQQTAEAIARVHGLDVITEPDIDEVWLGRWQGKRVSELRGDPDLERYIEDPTYECDAIEPAVKVQERTVAFVERLRKEKDNDGTYVLVSHGDPLRLLLVHYLEMALPLFRRLVIDNASVTILRFTPKAPKLTKLNTTPGTKLIFS